MEKIDSQPDLSHPDNLELDHIESNKLQDEMLLETLPLVRSIVRKRLRGGYVEAIDDIIQKVSLKMWQWRAKRARVDLSESEWKKIANAATQNEIKNFYGQRSHNEVQFPETSDPNGIGNLQDNSVSSKVEGNSETESRSITRLLWDAMQILSLREKFVFLMSDQSFVVDLIVVRCCSISELAAFLELSTSEFKKLVAELPLEDGKISEFLRKEFGITLSRKQLWNARGKAKAKLYRAIKGSIS